MILRKGFFVKLFIGSHILLPTSSAYSQAASKKTLPKVPITYPGDTEKTIVRRAEWVEGAKKEGNKGRLCGRGWAGSNHRRRRY